MFVYHYHCHFAPYTAIYDSLPELLMRAWVDIEYDYAHPYCVTVNDRDVMSETDLFDTAWANAPQEFDALAPYFAGIATQYIPA